MDALSSQLGNENVVSKRGNEGAAVIKEQKKAIDELKHCKIRNFRLENIEIKTIYDEKLFTKMWVSDEEPAVYQERIAEIFKCEICNREFDKRQKMLLHARFHKNEHNISNK